MYPMDTIQEWGQRNNTEGTTTPPYLKPSNLTIRVELMSWYTSGFT